jgi:plastocyanin
MRIAVTHDREPHGIARAISIVNAYFSSWEDPMLSFRLAAVFGLLVINAACAGSSSPATPSPAPAPGGSSSAVVIPAGASSLGNRAFSPDDINIAVGATVTWMNNDVVAHTSTSDRSGWNSGVVAPGGQFSFSFPTAGTFSYHCTIHPGMIGTVVVR